MSKPHTITIELQCGKNTCASEPGKFCQFLGTVRFGTIDVCRLFPDEDTAWTRLHHVNGWLHRCHACILAERDGAVENKNDHQ